MTRWLSGWRGLNSSYSSLGRCFLCFPATTGGSFGCEGCLFLPTVVVASMYEII